MKAAVAIITVANFTMERFLIEAFGFNFLEEEVFELSYEAFGFATEKQEQICK